MFPTRFLLLFTHFKNVQITFGLIYLQQNCTFLLFPLLCLQDPVSVLLLTLTSMRVVSQNNNNAVSPTVMLATLTEGRGSLCAKQRCFVFFLVGF